MIGEEMAMVNIYKFDPTLDKEPRYETYNLPYREQTVLDILNYIYEKYDPGLAFRYGCKLGACDCCLVLLNDRPVFACQEQAESEMKIGPLPKFMVIKDLVVDFNRLRK